MSKAPALPRFVAIIAGVALLGFIDYFLIIPSVDESSEEYLNDSLVLAASTYATSRVINAGVSSLQESTLTLSPWGVGIQMAPGQILDPINDATERLSNLCAQSLGLLATHRILISVVNHYTAPVLYGALLLLIVSAFFFRKIGFASLLLKFILLLVLLRISAPLMCVIGIYASERHFSPKLEEHRLGLSQVVEIVNEDFEYKQPAHEIGATSPKKGNVLQTIQSFFSDITETAKRNFQIARHRTEKISEAIEYLGKNLPETMENLTGLFATLLSKIIVQVFVIPLTTLYLLRLFFREIAGASLEDFSRKLVGFLVPSSEPKLDGARASDM